MSSIIRGDDNFDTNAIARSNRPSFSAKIHPSGATVSNNAWTKVLWTGTDIVDTDSGFADSKFTPQTAGTYFFAARVTFSQVDNDGANHIGLRKNGNTIHQVRFYSGNPSGGGGAETSGLSIQFLDTANGSSDYYEIYVLQNSGTRSIQGSTNFDGSCFFGFKLAGA